MAAMGVFEAAGHALLIVAHSFAPAPALTPVYLHSAHMDGRLSVLVFGDWPPTSTLVGAALVVAFGAYLALRERAGRRPLVTVACDRH
jgi:drug/metabolite transporter (DMT)-like permease